MQTLEWRSLVCIKKIVATSHCRIKKESDIGVFLEKRKNSYNTLMEAIDKLSEPMPEIRLGGEVLLERDIGNFDRLEELCIEGTDYILIEMPYTMWHEILYDSLYAMTLRKIRPIMAHIERFYVHKDDFNNLLDIDLIYQVNAESFIKKGMRNVIDYFIKNQMVHLVGSDMHNMDTRPQLIPDSYHCIEKTYGPECVDYLIKNSKIVLDNQYIQFFDFKKRSFFDKLFKR